MVNKMFGSFPDELLAEFHSAYAEASKTQKDCGPGERVVFGKCSKGDNMGNKQIDEAQKKERASTKAPDNSKPVMVNGKKMGWAIMNGQKVLVDYGSVAGEKKVGPKKQGKPSAKQGAKKPAQSPAPAPQPPAQQAATTLSNPNSTGSQRQRAINEVGKDVLENS
jgi:hypothetical protein